jgi:hypothetical protein
MSAAPSRIDRILAALVGRHGREHAIPAPEMERLTGIPERAIREELSIAYDDGTLEERELPAVGLPGIGFFLANRFEDFQEAHDAAYHMRATFDRRVQGIKRLAAKFGIHLNQRPQKP